MFPLVPEPLVPEPLLPEPLPLPLPRRVDDRRYDYTSEGGDFRAVLAYDAAGLIVDYPGIAVRFT